MYRELLNKALKDSKAAYKERRFHDMINILKNALVVDRTNIMILVNLGMAYLSLGDTTKAAACYRTAMLCEPDSAAVINNMARLCYRVGNLPAAEKLYRMLISINPAEDSYRVMLAHTLVLKAPWREVSQLAKSLSFFHSSGWLRSVFSMKPIDEHDAPIPWYTYSAIDFLASLSTQDMTVFEFGSGNSTLWWAQRARQVTSVEHDQGWARSVAADAPANATVRFEPDPAAYSALLRQYQPRDIVVIDGIMRTECAEVAAETTSPTGIIVFDNTDREDSVKGKALLTEKGWVGIDFWGLIPCYLYKSCTTVFIKDLQVLAKAQQHTRRTG